MAELEIHHEVSHGSDSLGQMVGVLAAVLAVVLALVTIASHRTHTHGIVLRTEAIDQWQYYQAKRLKFHNLELGEDLLVALGSKNEASERILDRYRKERDRYQQEANEIQEEARKVEREAQHAERQALRYDFGEGLLEIALILTSLYFISRKRFFPVVGIVAGLLGAGIAITGMII